MGFQFPRSQSAQPAATATAQASSAPYGGLLQNRPAFDLWRPRLSDADGADAYEIADHRAWSRDLARTNGIAASGISRWREYVVGNGLRLQSRIDGDELGITKEQRESLQTIIEKRFNMWANNKYASAEGDLNFWEIQQVLEESKQASGDVFALLTHKTRPNWPFKLAIQLIEADRVCNENNGANTSQIFEGIKRNEQGEIVSIFVANHHPWAAIPATTRAWQEIPVVGPTGRRNILHWKPMHRPGQSRGLPLPSIIVGTIKQLGRYTDAEIDAAVLAASDVIFAEMDQPSFEALYQPSEQQAYIQQALQSRQNATGYQTGRINNLFPGERVTTPTPGRPNPNAPAFFELFVKICAMGLNLPEEVLIGKFTTSYTAAQAAFQQWFQSVYIERFSLVWNICQPVHETFLEDCAIDGILNLPGFLTDPFARNAYCGSQWNGSGRFVLNPLQEANAARIRAGFLTSEADETQAYDGGDDDQRHAQRVVEAQRRREGGLPPLGETLPAAASRTGDSEDEDDSDQSDGDPLT